MTRRILDDTREGMAVETSYTYERAPDPKHRLAVFNNYRLDSAAPTAPGEPFTCTVRRWNYGTGVGDEIGVAKGATADEAMDRARAMAGDDWERQTVDPSPYWWQGVEVAK